MTTNTQKSLNHLELLRKYKYFQAIPSDELQAAQVHIPKGKSAIECLFEAARKYEKEVADEATRTGVRPNVCFDQDGVCEEDHCRCFTK